VRIVYVLPSRRGLALSQFERNNVNVAPNYNLLHWRPPHVNGVVFAELDTMDYVFIDSDETVTAWLLSNPVLDDPLDLMVYCYRDRGSERQDTPALRRVDYLNQNDVRNWAHHPAQRIGQMHSRELFDDRPADREGSDTLDGREDDTSHLSESSSGLSDSAHGSESSLQYCHVRL